MVGVVYFLLARSSLVFLVRPENLAVLWPPSGFALGLLLLRPRREWPSLLAVIGGSYFLARWTTDRSWTTGVGLGVANLVEAIIAAGLMRRVLISPIALARLSEVGMLILAAIVSSGLAGILGAWTASMALHSSFWLAWRTWLISHWLGILTVGPVLLTTARGLKLTFGRSLPQLLGDSVAFVLLVVLAIFIFGRNAESSALLAAFPYLTFPFLLWIAVRRGPRGAAFGSLVLSVIAFGLTALGRGPFVTSGGANTEHILALQIFLCVAELSALIVAAVMCERVSLEEALKQSEQRFRAIFESQYQFIGLMKPDGTLIEANRAALEFGGLRQEDVLGKPFWCARWWTLSPETQERLREAIRTAAAGEFVRYDVDVLGAGDEIATIDFSLKPVRDERGRVTLLIPEGRVITEMKQATQALVEQEATLRSFFDSAASMMGIVEIEGGNDICHLRDNATSRAFFQLSSEIQYPYSARALGVPEPIITKWVDHYRESAARGAPVQFEYEHPLPGGARWLSATVCPITPTTGARPRFAYVAQDITALKHQAARLEASLAEKDVLLKEIHHRVKNNLQVISSLLHLQLRHVSEPPARVQLLESERRVRAMALVHEQLYMGADLAGVEFPSYVDRLVDMLMRAYATPPHKVSTRLCIAPLLLDIDVAIPCGLLINELLSNSLKHAFPGDMRGEIWVSLARADAGHLLLSVKDTGIGLPPAFDPEAVRTMGLQLVRALAKQLGGTLRWESESGTELRVLFPSAGARDNPKR